MKLGDDQTGQLNQASATAHNGPLYQTLNYLNKKCLSLEYSLQRLSNSEWAYLAYLSHAFDFHGAAQSMLAGEHVNVTQGRAALHTALRALHVSSAEPHQINADCAQAVGDARDQMYTLARALRSGEHVGYTGKTITDVVNVGIGGSDLGPAFCVDALKPYITKALRFHFISDACPQSFAYVVEDLDPESTLFIISSKSFRTAETLHNMHRALSLYPDKKAIEQHFVAVTAHPEQVAGTGIKTILPIWDWVGGRFSVTSAINLITAIAIGPEQFDAFLLGARLMDEHFVSAPFFENMPMLLAALGVRNTNLLAIPNHLILTYARGLDLFVPYIQQLEMESNGKSCDLSGQALPYGSVPIIVGGAGNRIQHSYLQMICQGSHRFSVDMISLDSNKEEMINKICYAKKTLLADGLEDRHNRFNHIPGGLPLTHITLDALDPMSLGALIALYEHKVYIQSVIWGINAFDQPAVDSSKGLLFKDVKNCAPNAS